VSRLGQGHAAVWIFLAGGDSEKDDRAEALLRGELEKLSREMRSRPAGLPEGLAALRSDEESAAMEKRRFTFSLVRVKRDAPDEALLVNLLLASEPDLRTFDEPMAFPVFGRGRLLYALVGAGINPEMIEKACRYLVDGCSCQVKAENPGMDLLVCADWEEVRLDALSHYEADDSDTVPPSLPSTCTVTADQASSPTSPGLVRNSLLGVAGGLGVVAVAAWMLSRKGRRTTERYA
jgi:hypothetical protein